MISKDHLIAPKNGEVDFLIGTMRIVPNTASRRHHECTGSLDEGIAPKSTKDKGIELVETATGIRLDTGKDWTAGSHEGSSGNDVK